MYERVMLVLVAVLALLAIAMPIYDRIFRDSEWATKRREQRERLERQRRAEQRRQEQLDQEAAERRHQEWLKTRPLVERDPEAFWAAATSAWGTAISAERAAELARPKSSRDWREKRYGDAHKAERAKYAEKIRLQGGVCMEKVCVMPSRRIEPGAFWHLAHDHDRGGHHDYLGPAHPECNQYEAKQRGVEWIDGGPTSSAGDDPWAVQDVATDDSPN